MAVPTLTVLAVVQITVVLVAVQFMVDRTGVLTIALAFMAILTAVLPIPTPIQFIATLTATVTLLRPMEPQPTATNELV